MKLKWIRSWTSEDGWDFDAEFEIITDNQIQQHSFDKKDLSRREAR